MRPLQTSWTVFGELPKLKWAIICHWLWNFDLCQKAMYQWTLFTCGWLAVKFEILMERLSPHMFSISNHVNIFWHWSHLLSFVVVVKNWGDWGHWGHCDKSCGGGYVTRHRECVQVKVEGKGDNIDNCHNGGEQEVRRCNTHCCPGGPRYNKLINKFMCVFCVPPKISNVMYWSEFH